MNVLISLSPKCYSIKNPKTDGETNKKLSTEMIICHLFSTHAQAVTILKCIDGRAAESGTGRTTIYKLLTQRLYTSS